MEWKEVVSHLKTFTNKGCEIATQIIFFFFFFPRRIKASLSQFCEDQEVIQQVQSKVEDKLMYVEYSRG